MQKNLFSAGLIAIATLAPTSLFADAAPTFRTEGVTIRIDDSGAIIVPVRVNGNGPFPFLLDTGAAHSVISDALAERLALRFVAKTAVLTTTGREWRPVVEIDQTTIECARSERLQPSVVPSAQLHDIARGIEGMVGQDFLFAFNYTLDYRNKRLTWNDGAQTPDDVRLPLVAQAGRYLVQVRGSQSHASMLLVPDSGASGFVAYERNGRTTLALNPGAGVTSVESLAGEQRARTMILRELRLGGIRLRDYAVAVIARDPDDVVEGDGLLPLHLFASVSFSARERRLVIRR